MDFKRIFKKYGAYAAAVVIFALAAIIYCKPAMSGKVLVSHDNNNWLGASHQSVEYAAETGEGSWWNDAMFCGMPNYQIGGGIEYRSDHYKWYINRYLHKCIYDPVWAMFFYFACFFLVLLAFGVSPWISLLGAIAIGLSSYFIVLLPAGHNTKIASIALTAVVFAGYKLIFDRKYILGGVLTMVFVASGYALHPQVFYYYCMMMGLLWFAELWQHIKEKKVKQLAVSTAVFVVAVVIGLGTGMSNIFVNKEYVKESTRGGSDLAPYLAEMQQAEEKAAEEGSVQAKDEYKMASMTMGDEGLNIEYATRWSYGIDETMTLMIPGFKGGSSFAKLGENSVFRKILIKNNCTDASIRDISASSPVYWGPQPMTQGSVYVGAIICFLFVLGLCVVKGPYKWMLLACTVFSIMLSWGKNFMWLTELFFNYFPMYNKFRAVSSVLVVAEVTMPLLGLLALDAIVRGKVESKKLLKYTMISAGVTAGLCLFFFVFGNVFYDFTSPNDAKNILGYPDWFMKGLYAQRKSLYHSDCLRSFFFIIAAAGAVWLHAKGKMKAGIMVAIVGILSIIDLWGVDRRYFDDSNFHRPSKAQSTFLMEEYEQHILKDPALNFRVFNVSLNAFNDSRTSFYLKSIGGYSAAKLSRYNDLIEHDLKTLHMPVINMLNTRYIIARDKGADSTIVRFNREAMGNAWWVTNFKIAENPKEEIESLMQVDLRTTAVVGKDFEKFVDGTKRRTRPAVVQLLKAHPGYLEYFTNSLEDGVVVFSEIYYPYGWKACIDGKPVEHFRANYVLRALNVPAGKHGITFTFDPDSVRKGDNLAIVFITLMYILMAAAVAYGIFKLVRNYRKAS